MAQMRCRIDPLASVGTGERRGDVREKARVAACLVLAATTLLAATYSIPEAKLDPRKLFWGKPSSFEKPGEIRYDKILTATPEHETITKQKIKSGTGKYWVLASRASTRVKKAISKVGEKTDYDLIALEGYLASLDPPIPAENITDLVITAMLGKDKDNDKDDGDNKRENDEDGKKK